MGWAFKTCGELEPGRDNRKTETGNVGTQKSQDRQRPTEKTEKRQERDGPNRDRYSVERGVKRIESHRRKRR